MSTIRLSGMASGLDTESIVEQLMQVEKQKYYKVERQMYKTEYQIEAYRNVTDKLKDFKSKYLDLLSSTNMMSSSTYRKFDTNITDATGNSSKAVKITSTSGANAGSHTLEVLEVAKKASLEGEKVTGVLKTKDIENLKLEGKKIEFTLDGKTESITLSNYDTIDDMSADIKAKLDKAYGNGFDGTSGKIDVSVDNGTLKFKTVNGATNLTVYDSEDSLSFKTTTTALSTSKTLEEISESFSKTLEFGPVSSEDTENDCIKFTINGKEFMFDKEDTLTDIMNEVNNDTEVGVTLSYNSTSGKFELSSDLYGAGEEVVVEDISGNFFEATGLKGENTKYTAGCDTKAIVDGVEISRSSVTFSIDGITYEAKDVTNGEITVDLSLNTDEVFDSIVDFIESYNTLIGEIDSLLNEEYDRDYQPLTEDERAEMTEEQIEKWDKKAKTGLLRNDPMLTSLLSELRSCFSQGVSGVGMTISDIGLKTGTYTDKGKIVIDEKAKSQLKTALADNLDTVISLFTKNSENYPYSSRTYTSSEKSTRMSQQGLMHRISDVLDNYVSTYRDSSGRKGKLLEKAGIVGDTTEITSTLSKKLAEYDKKMDSIMDLLDIQYDRYYKKFSAMETAIQNANSQASYLTSMFGGGTTAQ